MNPHLDVMADVTPSGMVLGFHVYAGPSFFLDAVRSSPVNRLFTIGSRSRREFISGKNNSCAPGTKQRRVFED